MQNLRELKGQPIAARILSGYLKAHPPPLLIFSGPEGTGKWSAAEAFIQQSLCEVGTGCGACPPCRKILRGEHPDFVRFPDQRVAIGESQDPEPFTIRWLLNTRMPYTPFAGRLRFVLFPRADLIQNEAETALLKTLEEPPAHTRFVFLVRSLDELKPTIVSRGITVPFRLLPERVLVELDPGLTADALRILGGSLHLAPFLRTPLYQKMREMLTAALAHPQALAQLEKWLAQTERKTGRATADRDDEDGESTSLTYAELLDVCALLLLCLTENHPERSQLAAAVFELKGELHREAAGMLPYLLGRFFFRLDTALFRKTATPA